MWHRVLFWWGEGDVRQTAVKNTFDREIVLVDLTCQTRLNLWMKAWGHPNPSALRHNFLAVMVSCLTLTICCHQQLINLKKFQLLSVRIVTPDPAWIRAFYVSHPTRERSLHSAMTGGGSRDAQSVVFFLRGTQKSTEAARGSSVRRGRAWRPGDMQIEFWKLSFSVLLPILTRGSAQT